MEKATGACEAAAYAQDRKIDPLMARQKNPFLHRQLHKD
jgi:hypothetical protein